MPARLFETDGGPEQAEVCAGLAAAFSGLSVRALLHLSSLPEPMCAALVANLLAQHALERSRGKQPPAPLPPNRAPVIGEQNESLAWAHEAGALALENEELRRRLAESEARLEPTQQGPSPEQHALDEAELASLAESLGIGAAELEKAAARFGAGARITIQVRDAESPDEQSTAGFRHPHHVLVADQSRE